MPGTDAERQMLQEWIRERDALNTAIDFLSKRLGVESQGSPGAPAPGPDLPPGSSPTIGAKDDVAASINPGSFYGMTASKAAAELLQMVGRGRPLRTIEIYRAITKGGVSLKSPTFLTKSLQRNSQFHRVGRGLWGLKEWYGNAAEWTPAAGEPDEDELDELDENEKNENGEEENGNEDSGR